MGRLRLRSSELQWRSVEGEVVALDLRGSQYLGVNNSGADLWDLLAAGTTSDALAEHLVQTFGLPPEVAQTDVRDFVAQLRAQDLIEDIE